MPAENVCFNIWVLWCSRACGPSNGSWWLEPKWFSTMSAEYFQQRSLINRLHSSINQPHVCDRCSCKVVCVCVCPSGSWRLQNCGHPAPLVKLHLHQNHRPPYQTSFPSSQPARQPTTRRGPYQCYSAVLLFIFLMFLFASLLFFTNCPLVRKRKLRSNLWFLFARTTHAAIIKEIQQTETHLWVIIMSTSKAKQTFC